MCHGDSKGSGGFKIDGVCSYGGIYNTLQSPRGLQIFRAQEVTVGCDDDVRAWEKRRVFLPQGVDSRRGGVRPSYDAAAGSPQAIGSSVEPRT